MRIQSIITALLLSAWSFAQDGPPEEINFREPAKDSIQLDSSDLRLLFKNTDQGLKIRWAPRTPQVWLLGNQFGYTLERVKLDSTTTKDDFQEVGVFRPLPLAEWESIVDDSSPYTAAAAMAIHGESAPGNQGIIPNAQDLQNKFGFALLAADLDWNAATASGLGWIDDSVDETAMYVYRLFVNETVETTRDTVYEYVVKGDYTEYFPIKISDITENENELVLEWEDSPFRPYSAYHIERSVDGINFNRITESPYVTVTTNLVENTPTKSFVDSVEVNYLKYYYRIIGLDAFGDESGPSNVIQGMGRDRTNPSTPLSINATEITPGEMTISWQWESSATDNDFKGFNIYKSLNYEEGFVRLNETLLPADTRQFVDGNPDPRETNYYYVTAVDEEGNEGRSTLAFGITKDEIPPGPPTNLRATVDTTGLLLLEWDAPADNDIRGYQVLYSNAGDAEFGARSGDYLPFNHFVDSISLETLTKNIFYYVIAIDYSYNQSIASEILEVKRPDIIAPEASIFTDYRVSEEGIYFEWLISSSNDVASVELQRKEGEGRWEKLSDFDPSGNNYLDKNAEGGVLYSYQLVTTDESGNQTVPEKSLVLEGLSDFFIAEVRNAKGIKTDEGLIISWEYDASDYIEFILYKGRSESSKSTYLKIENGFTADVPSYDLTEESSFWIKARSKDGRDSKLVLIDL